MILDPLRPYLDAIKFAALAAALIGAYWLGSSNATARCEKAALEANAAAQSQAIADSAKADAASASREQAKIIRQAALDGARKAIKEAQDACADSDADPAILDALRLPSQSPAP